MRCVPFGIDGLNCLFDLVVDLLEGGGFGSFGFLGGGSGIAYCRFAFFGRCGRSFTTCSRSSCFGTTRSGSSSSSSGLGIMLQDTLHKNKLATRRLDTPILAHFRESVLGGVQKCNNGLFVGKARHEIVLGARDGLAGRLAELFELADV